MDATSTTLRKSSNYDDTTAGAEASQKAPRILPPTPEPQVTSRDKTLLNKPTSVKLVRLAVFLVVVVAPFLFVIVLSKVLGGSNKAYLTSKVTQHFCCPNELQAVLRGINSTIDPCNDFYGHVCSRIDAGEVEHMSPLFRVIQQLNLMELAAPAQSSSAAGEMLAALRQGLWDAGRSPEDIADYVTAIVKVGNPAPRMNLIRMARFLAELSLRYGLPSVVSFEISEAGTVLIVRRNGGCFSQKAYEDMLQFALESFNNVLNTSVTIDELHQIEENVAARRDNNSSKIISQDIHNSPFSGLPEGDWTAILNDLLLPLHPNATTVETKEGDNLNGLMNILANAYLQPATVAYAAVCSALKTHDVIEAAALRPEAQSLSGSCKALDICEIEQAYMADVMSTHRMNEYVTTFFAKIRNNVIRQAHVSFGGLSEEEITRKLRKLRLVLPEQIVVSDIPVPTASENYAANFIAARSYVFEARRAKMARNIPSVDSLFLPAIVRRGDAAYLPINLYAILQKRAKRVVALDVPVLGVDMAFHLWSFLLEQSWSAETSHSIETYKACFNSTGSWDYPNTAITALGVVSAIDAMMAIDWNVVSSVNDAEMSVGRLVYLLWAYDKCASLPIMGTSVDVNLVLRNSPAFRPIFGCPQSAALAQRTCCLGTC